MLKHLTVAAVTLATLSLSPVPVITGAAIAQAACIAQCREPKSSPSTYSCTNQLGYLRRVHEEELDEIVDPNRVFVTPVCVQESYGMMRSDGNAGALRQAIAANDAIQEALFRKNFLTEDVVGIQMTGDGTAVFYVHPFLHSYY
jgi:hypothetical protein